MHSFKCALKERIQREAIFFLNVATLNETFSETEKNSRLRDWKHSYHDVLNARNFSLDEFGTWPSFMQLELI